MGRKKDDTDEFIIAQMSKVLSCITDKQNLLKVKTWEDLWNVAYQWCAKEYTHSENVAPEWGVAPVYLILTALLYVEHPLLVGEGRSWKYSLSYALALIAQVEFNRLDIGIPIKSTDKIHRDVETIRQPVERTP